MKTRLLPDCMPRDWYAGFVHHHTAFGYKKPHAVSSAELIPTVRELGGSFVFCAGDHGCEYGKGWYEGKDYYKYCLAQSARMGTCAGVDFVSYRNKQLRRCRAMKLGTSKWRNKGC